jgi:probable HAF family extracellular repeat protein
MNQQGEVVGYSWVKGGTVYHAFLWSKAAGMKDLGTLGGINSYGLGINRFSQVVGWATIPGASFSYHAFCWTQSGGMKDLGTLGGSESLARGITDAGQVVGSANLAGDTAAHAFLWTASGGLQDLNNMIPANSGWELDSANAINGSGLIVGDGLINGQIHAFLLTPTGAASRF